MKNITVTVDDETYRNARMKAAALDTSVSALVKRYLVELGAGETEFQHLKRRERELRERVPRDSVRPTTFPTIRSMIATPDGDAFSRHQHPPV